MDASTPLVIESALDPYSRLTPKFIGVVDADVLLSSVKNDCEHGADWRSRLLRMTDQRKSFLFAADHVYFEVYRGLPKIAKSSTASLSELRSRFEEQYLPAVRFVSMSAEQPCDEQVALVTDPTDVPTAQLARLVAPCVVFSGDQHLRKPGIAPSNWRSVAGAGVAIADASLRASVATNSVALPVQGAARLVRVMADRVGLPPWLVLSLTASVAAVYLKSDLRRAKLGAVAGAVGTTLLAQLAEATEDERRATRELRPALLAERTDAMAKGRVATILARQCDALLAREIKYLINDYFSVEPSETVSDIRTVLLENPEFAKTGRYRWQFGRECEPLAPSVDIANVGRQGLEP